MSAETASKGRAGGRELLDALVTTLLAQGYRVMGPRREGAALQLEPIDDVDQLPWAVVDAQGPGRYRLEQYEQPVAFAHGPLTFSMRRLVSPPEERLVTLRRKGAELAVEPAAVHARPTAVIGAKGCDLRALRAQDAVFRDGAHPDPRYVARREALFTVAVACHRPADTCFCVSRGGDVRPDPDDADLLLTELVSASPRYLLEASSDRGREVLDAMPGDAIGEDDRVRASDQDHAAREAMVRALPREAAQAALLAAEETEDFEAVAERCLACQSCTAVCPTCFCVTVEEEPSYDGQASTRVRRRDSCFSPDFSYMHGGAVRGSRAGRYRHWMRHKLATWSGQWGLDGCVGCGRCTTWCPAGIDFVAEATRHIQRQEET